MIRLFIALPLPREIEQYLGKIMTDLSKTGGGVKWVDAHQIHLTVRFLGDTPPELVAELSRGIGEIAQSAKPVTATLERVGGFPNLKRPRVIWVGMQEVVPQLPTIAQAAEELARRLEFEPENKLFKAHLTLGRVKDERKLAQLPQALSIYQVERRSFSLDRLILFQSTLTPQGSIYKHLHEAKLGA